AWAGRGRARGASPPAAPAHRRRCDRSARAGTAGIAWGGVSALIVLACLVGAWEAYADLGATSSFVLPAPHAIAAALWDNAGLLGANLLPTALEVGLGIALALALGFALAIAVHLSAAVRRALYPLAVGSQAVPIAVIAPLLVFWWGFGVFP